MQKTGHDLFDILAYGTSTRSDSSKIVKLATAVNMASVINNSTSTATAALPRLADKLVTIKAVLCISYYDSNLTLHAQNMVYSTQLPAYAAIKPVAILTQAVLNSALAMCTKLLPTGFTLHNVNIVGGLSFK